MADERKPEEEIRQDPDRAAPEGGDGEPVTVSRRNFLLGAGAGVLAGAAGASGIFALNRPAPVAAPQTSAPAAPAAQQPAAAAPAAPGAAPAAPSSATTGTGTVPSSLPATQRQVTLDLDGKKYDLVVDVRESLWETLTKKLGMGSSMNLGCDRAQCGACAVVVDGRALNGCSILTARLGRGQKIVTVASLAKSNRVEDLHPIQKAFWDEGGYQCGICTRGFIMSAYALLEKNKNPSEADIVEALSGNLCRCSEYPKIYNSVVKAAELMRRA